ncbi:uncharacterized protein LOC131859127 [Cryptomeria japonica]|uniref:uncharacterized protein LOC131859127 n=1 Tax=Cryptomeria japonica TaxID=3369 RepID=UPI0027D9F656|nr:uncharacterized protein LOC131859127 [Cryptomeria japonica]
MVMMGGMDSATFQKHKSLNSQLEEILSREQIYWRKKSRDLWLSDGDRNTKFFHALTKLKHQRCQISSIHNSDGVVLTKESDIVNEGVRFFKSLLSEESSIFCDNFTSFIPKLMTVEDNAMLMAPFSIQEVKDIVFSMSPEKVPSPDGFTVLFFQKCWSFLGEDLHLVLEEARCNQTMLRDVNSTIIARIPKCENLVSFMDFRPIALYMMKAYDRVNWQALLSVLSKFEFGVKWVEWIRACISTARFSILLNGSPCGFFASSRGLRQGDPLSPFLFIILVEAYSRAISCARERGLWKGISIPRMSIPHTHCFFVDDTLLFGLAFMREAQSRLSRYWGFSVGPFPCKYLGLPFYTGSEKHNFWERVSGAISSKILSWSHKWSTFSGKIVLIKAVLNVIPIYLLSILKAPKKIVGALHSIVRSFLWNNNVDKTKRISLLAWDRVCAPKDKGGAGIRELGKQNLALGAKLVWKFYKQPTSKWASILSAKYLPNCSKEVVFTTSALPKGFVIWNFMNECRFVIFPGLSWLIHNGRKARFWDEVWNGFPIMSSLRDRSSLMPILKSSWGIFVADYFFVDSSGSLQVAKWKSIASLLVGQDIKSAFEDELKKRPLLFSGKDDELIWTFSKSREYSVKEGYNFLSLDVKREVLPFKLFWHAVRLPKVGAFAWLAIQDRILTGMRLDRLGITVSRPPINRKEVVWLPPPVSKVKLNFDGASRGNPGKSAIGIVVSDARAAIISTQCKCIAYGTNNVVELHALSLGLDLLLLLYLLDVVIEGDSQVVFYMVTNRSSHSWHLKYWLNKILDQLVLFNSF